MLEDVIDTNSSAAECVSVVAWSVGMGMGVGFEGGALRLLELLPLVFVVDFVGLVVSPITPPDVPPITPLDVLLISSEPPPPPRIYSQNQ